MSWRTPFSGVVKDGPTKNGTWLLQKPPRTGSTWLKTEKIQNRPHPEEELGKGQQEY